jgi:glycosyltransferase involved in cell wall biosynthesis
VRLSLAGCGPHPWTSVERTRQAFLRALGARFTLRHVAEDAPLDPTSDALLNFSGPFAWELTPHPDMPLLFAMHGGAVLNQEALRGYLGRLESTDTLIVNCTSDMAVLRRMFAGEAPRLCHLPLPVDPKIFHPPPSRRRCRERLPIGEPDFVVGFVARLLPQKNLHQFLRLLARLVQRLAPRSVLGLIVGSYWIDYPVLPYVTAEYPQHIAALIEELDLGDHVAWFPGGVSDRDLALCYGAMDVLVHPTASLDENFGYAPVEAMACGTPVVGSAYGGLKDTIVPGETGFLMPTWVTAGGLRIDLIQGLDDLERLLLDADLRARLSASAVRRVREEYSYRAFAHRLRAAVTGAVHAHRNGEARPLTLAPPPQEPPPSGLLPATQPPWEHYQEVVACYVSGPPPEPAPDCRVQLAAPLEPAGDGALRLADPAWPAVYWVDPSSPLSRAAGVRVGEGGQGGEGLLALAERCREPVLCRELIEAGLADPQRLRELIAAGLLLGSPGNR